MRRVLVLMALATVVSSCNTVFGWDQAHDDPLLDSGDDCQRYCNAMDANCQGTNLKYITPDVCLQACGQMEPGATNDVTGDSITCRLHFASLKAKDDAEQAANCDKGSMTGGGVCGVDACHDFCKLDTSYCAPPNVDPPPYASGEDCLTACASKPPFDPTLRISDDQDRDTVNCRVYHLQAALVSPQAQPLHCKHTSAKNIVCASP